MSRRMSVIVTLAMLVALLVVGSQAAYAEETNRARVATASAEALNSVAPYYNESFAPALAIDGDMGTRWSAYPDNDYADQRFILEWATPQTINRVVVYQAWALMTMFTVEYWDGTDWQIAGEFGAPTSTTAEGTFEEPVTTTKLRIANPVTDYEIQAWGEGVTQGVTGYVTSLESGKGVAGVTVSAQGQTTATGADGGYLLVLPTVGSTEVTVEKGVIYATDTVTVPENDLAQLDFTVPTYNIAAAATASSSSRESDSTGPELAINGIDTDRFVFNTSVTTDPDRWFELNWAEPVSFNTIVMRQWDACCRTKHLKIETGNRPTNLARLSTATSSSQEGSDTGPELAINGIYTDRFVFSGDDPDRWLQLEWPDAVTFNTIKLNQWSACCQTSTLKIEAWDATLNGGAGGFTEVTTATIDPLSATITVPTQTTKKLRVSDPELRVVMEIGVSNDDGNWQLTEVTTTDIDPYLATITIPTQTVKTLRVSSGLAMNPDTSDSDLLTVIMEMQVYNTVSVTGTVTNAATGAGIPYVSIVGGSSTAISGAGGVYSVDAPVGDITLRASKELFDGAVVPVTVPAEGATKDFTMTGPADLVLLASGASASTSAAEHVAAMGIDQDPTTYWTRSEEDEDNDNRATSFIVEWPSEQTVDTVSVPVGVFFDMDVDIWRDGGWIAMGHDGDSLTAQTSGFVQFSPILTSKIRLRKMLTINDVEVYNINGEAPAENLRGIVKNAYSGKPLIGVTVMVGTLSTTTGENGRYYLTVPSGSTTVTVSRKGYDSASKTVTVPETGRIYVDFDLTTNNIATLATAKASAYMAGLDPSLANDDDYSTRWSQYPDNSYGLDWFEYDWPFEVTLTGVTSHEFGGWMSQFRAYYWDGAAWQLAGQLTGALGLDPALTFGTPVTTKKLRIFTPITSWEIEAFGCASVSSVADAKNLPDGAFVKFTGSTTAVFSDAGYVEKGDRTCGVRVEPATGFGSVGDLATVTGVIGTDGFERVIHAQEVEAGEAQPVEPLGMPNKSLTDADTNGVQSSVSYSGNMAIDGMASASSYEVDMPPGLAVDGDMDTLWATKIDDDYTDDYFQIDWSTSVTLTGLKIYQALVEGSVPMPQLRAYYWDGSDWQLAGQYGDGVTQPPATDIELTFAAPVTTTKLRLFSPVTDWEIEVYGSGSEPIMTAGPVSTVGLLVTTWGKVTNIVDAGNGKKYIYVDDGSSVTSDIAGVTGVKVGPVATDVVITDFVKVTGVARLMDADGVPVRMICPRTSDDVRK